MEAHTKITILYRNGITVYPIHTAIGWKIGYTINGKEHKFDKVVTEKQINSKKWSENPIGITIDYFIKKLGYDTNNKRG